MNSVLFGNFTNSYICLKTIDVEKEILIVELTALANEIWLGTSVT